MYKSPIEVIFRDMSRKFEGDILKAIQKYDVVIDKEGLIRALKYDRHQYEKGYVDGKQEAMDSIVRCKDCVHWYDREKVCLKIYSDGAVSQYAWQERKEDDFCSYGERRTDDAEN